jgi:hypothetical protein
MDITLFSFYFFETQNISTLKIHKIDINYYYCFIFTFSFKWKSIIMSKFYFYKALTFTKFNI